MYQKYKTDVFPENCLLWDLVPIVIEQIGSFSSENIYSFITNWVSGLAVEVVQKVESLSDRSPEQCTNNRICKGTCFPWNTGHVAGTVLIVFPNSLSPYELEMQLLLPFYNKESNVRAGSEAKCLIT